MTNPERVPPFVEVSRVTKSFPAAGDAFSALREVSLSIALGELVAVVGKSGSGKSTLLNMIAGIDRPSAGDVVVGGQSLNALDESGLARWRGANVGVVFQFFQLLPTLTVLENVLLPMDFARRLSSTQAERRARELLAQVGIADQAGKMPSALSGGQQQRAAIARALANDPPLLLADEPTGNLDSAAAAAVAALLRAQVQAGKSVVMVTHDPDVARLATRVITLSDGRVTGAPADQLARAS